MSLDDIRCFLGNSVVSHFFSFLPISNQGDDISKSNDTVVVELGFYVPSTTRPKYGDRNFLFL